MTKTEVTYDSIEELNGHFKIKNSDIHEDASLKYNELYNYFGNFREFENILYKHNISSLKEAWKISKAKKMTKNELDRLIGQPISTEGYISHSKLYVPKCPYCGKSHVHDDMRYDIERDIGTMSTNRAKCEFVDCYKVTICSKEDILRRGENEKINNIKLMTLFSLYIKSLPISDLVNNLVIENNFKDNHISVKRFKKYQICKIHTKLLKGVSLSEMMVIFQAGNIWNELSNIIGMVHIKEFHVNRFPDLVGIRKNLKSGELENVNIEFESISSNFVKHGHPSDKCDIIICWKHDWINCPKNIEIIELCDIINKNKNNEISEKNIFETKISNSFKITVN